VLCVLGGGGGVGAWVVYAIKQIAVSGVERLEDTYTLYNNDVL